MHDTVHLPAPKNLSSHAVELQRDTPFFATSDAPIVLVKRGSIDHTNTQMMNVRWRFFHFWRQIPVDEQQELELCGHCFARFILETLRMALPLKLHTGVKYCLHFSVTFLTPENPFFDTLLHASSHFIVESYLLPSFLHSQMLA